VLSRKSRVVVVAERFLSGSALAAGSGRSVAPAVRTRNRVRVTESLSGPGARVASRCGIALAIVDRSCYFGRVGRRGEDVAELVRDLRSRLGLTQEELARELGVSFSTVNGWENKKHSPLPVLMRQLRMMAGAAPEQSERVPSSRRTRKR
jgi:putative transcriptional regulator